LESVGTPNRLLQTDLAELPTVVIQPAVLPPVILFEGSFKVTAQQVVSLQNTAKTPVNFTVRTPPRLDELSA
jgi:hypothetical protein